jgi:uncharacterized protein (TIGR02246 family)
MVRSIRLLSALVILLASSAPTALGQPAADSASVTAFYGRWFGSAARGFTAYASFYAEDGYILPPGSPPTTGRAAIAAWFEQTRAALPYTTEPQGIAVDEMRFLTPEWVVYRSTLRGQRVAKTGGDRVPFETKYVDLLHRVEGGNWEVAFRMWSDNR